MGLRSGSSRRSGRARAPVHTRSRCGFDSRRRVHSEGSEILVVTRISGVLVLGDAPCDFERLGARRLQPRTLGLEPSDSEFSDRGARPRRFDLLPHCLRDLDSDKEGDRRALRPEAPLVGLAVIGRAIANAISLACPGLVGLNRSDGDRSASRERPGARRQTVVDRSTRFAGSTSAFSVAVCVEHPTRELLHGRGDLGGRLDA